MRIALIVLLCGCVLTVGCGKKAIEAASGGKVDIQRDGEKVTIETPDGKVTTSAGASAEKPDDFPKDVYCCKGSIIATVKVPNGWMLTIESMQKPESIVAEARKTMSGNGWKEAMFMKQEDGAMIAFSKSDGKRSCTLQIGGKKNGKTAVTVTAANN